MRVLHLFPRFRPTFTGDGLYFEKLWPLLVAAGGGHDVLTFVTPKPDHPEALIPYRPPGTRLFFLRRSAGEHAAVVLLRFYFWLLLHIRQYAVIHSHSHVDRYLVMHWLAKLLGVPIVYSSTLDDTPAEVARSYRPAYQRLVASTLRATVARYVVISRRLYEDSLSSFDPAKLEIVPQGVAIPPPPPDDRAVLRAELGIETDAQVQLYVGGICARKDVLFLIENFTLPSDSAVRKYLLIVGPVLEEDYMARLQQRIAERGLAGNVRFLGYHDDPSRFYRLADVFVFASQQEGFGNVLLEAMAHGLPVISRRLHGVTDFFIAQGETGLLFETAEEYAGFVAWLEADPRARRNLGEKAAHSAAQDYALPKIAQRYDAIYRATLAEGGRRA